MSLFDSFAGNENLKSYVTSIIKNNMVSHAYIVEGVSGSGKKTFARLFAAALLCTSAEKPCGKCPGCIKALGGGHPDIITISGQEDKAIGVDELRDMHSDVYILPNEGERKVYIINRAQDMTIQAQNALLKVFEEPPSHAVIILLCDNISKLLPTILSRAVKLQIHPLDNDDALKLIKSIRNDAPDILLEQAVSLSRGVVGTAIDYIDSGILKTLPALCKSFVGAMTGSDEYTYLKIYEEFLLKKKDFLLLVSLIIVYLRDILSIKETGQNNYIYFVNNKDDLVQFSMRLTSKQITNIINILNRIRENILLNANFNLTVLNMLLKCREEVF